MYFNHSQTLSFALRCPKGKKDTVKQYVLQTNKPLIASCLSLVLSLDD